MLRMTQFTWDPAKAAANEKKHGVAFEEALAVFGDPLARIHADGAHSDREGREIIVGHSTKGQLLLVSFAERAGVIRLISARRVTRHEREDYEETSRG
jgi:uncharacterized DUF497 family protein